MHLKYNFETMELDDRIIAVPVGEGTSSFKGIIKMNETGAAIFELLKTDTTEEAIVKEMEKEYEGDTYQLASDVKSIIADFVNKGLVAL